jgi:hypothetical protein
VKEVVPMSATPSIARLAAETHESITITFEPTYRPATPGSSAWSIIAKNIRVTLSVPAERPLPNWVLARMLARTSDPYALIDEYIVLQIAKDRGFSGTASFPLTIETGSSGQAQSYNQRFEFVSFYGFSNLSFDDAVMFERAGNAESLIDPINHTPLFQVSMFEASPYSRTDSGLWPTLG